MNFLQNDGSEPVVPDGITYLTFDVFAKINLKEGGIDPEKTLLIIDEVDSLLFRTPLDYEGLQKVFNPFGKLIGLTGSDFKDFHKLAASKTVSGDDD